MAELEDRCLRDEKRVPQNETKHNEDLVILPTKTLITNI